jgi:anti-sigma regulatory factor (Ser/Thr protein kinase)
MEMIGAFPGGPVARGGPISVEVAVSEPSRVGEARRAAAMLAAESALTESAAGALAIVVTELATNLARHAEGGVLFMRSLAAGSDGSGAGGVELLALDRGPGIRDVDRAMGDGYSTGGSAGNGLGAVRRMATEFDIHSEMGRGTAVVARVRSPGSRAAVMKGDRALVSTGAICRPIRGEFVCGDAWRVLDQPHRTVIVVADGLGHGRDAAIAATAAMQVVLEHPQASPAEMIHLAHGALRSTRGAALAAAAIDRLSRTVRFAGVGNIIGAVVTAQGMRSMASHNGIVGHELRRVQEFGYPWADDACVLLHSDGISARWRLDQHPGLIARDPALIAGIIFRDHQRGRDDATALAVRTRPPAR